MAVDALVIGAGPAGSAAARLLAQAGWSVTLVEKAAFPRPKVCGEFISAATLPVLEACGVADAFSTAAGPPATRVAAYVKEMMIEAPLPRGAGMEWGRALGREHLDALLCKAAVAAGAQLLQPAEIVALRRAGNAHVATLECVDGQAEIAAKVVIVACGSWNAKGPFAITRPPRPSDLFAFKAHFCGSALPAGLLPLIAFPGGYGGMVHSDGGRISLSVCIRRDRLTRAREMYVGKAAEAVFQHIATHTAGVRLALRDAVRDGGFLSTGPLRPGIRPRHLDGVFFTGNIAGEAHPIIAEGISMAIQSSWLLAQCLIAGGPTTGAAYAQAWIKQFAARLRAASLFAHCAIHDPTRVAATQLIRAFPGILTWGAALSGKVTAVMSAQRSEVRAAC